MSKISLRRCASPSLSVWTSAEPSGWDRVYGLVFPHTTLSASHTHEILLLIVGLTHAHRSGCIEPGQVPGDPGVCQAPWCRLLPRRQRHRTPGTGCSDPGLGMEMRDGSVGLLFGRIMPLALETKRDTRGMLRGERQSKGDADNYQEKGCTERAIRDDCRHE